MLRTLLCLHAKRMYLSSRECDIVHLIRTYASVVIRIDLTRSSLRASVWCLRLLCTSKDVHRRGHYRPRFRYNVRLNIIVPKTILLYYYIDSVFL